MSPRHLVAAEGTQNKAWLQGLKSARFFVRHTVNHGFNNVYAGGVRDEEEVEDGVGAHREYAMRKQATWKHEMYKRLHA